MTSDERAYLDEQFGVIKEQFGAIQEQFGAMDRRFDAMDRRFDAMDQRLDAMDRRLDAMDRRLDAVETDMRKLGVLMEDKDQNVRLLAEQFSTLQAVTNDKIDDLREEFGRRLDPLTAAVRQHFMAS